MRLHSTTAVDVDTRYPTPVEFFDRRRLQLLVPSPTVTPAVEVRLRAVPEEVLVEVVLSREEPWWRRRACAKGLVGRVPDARAGALLDCVTNTKDVSELRVVLMELLATQGRAHSPVLLAWLQAQEGTDQSYGMDVAILRARAALGDVSAIASLSELAADAWTHRRTAGEAALDALIEQAGQQVVLAALGAPAAELLAFEQQRPMSARLLGVRLVHRAGGDVTPALGDPSVIVAQRAAAIATEAGQDEALWARVHGRLPGQLWALVVLQRRGLDVKAEWVALGSPRVELAGVPDEVREAIARHYVPGERETDPRWLLEAAFLPPHEALDEAELLSRAERALLGANLRPEPPVSAGEEHQQGSGTYSTIHTAVGAVLISSLGPFFSADAPIEALSNAGFRYIDASLSGTVFAGLHVYFFGRREPLCVHDLLFYWQD